MPSVWSRRTASGAFDTLSAAKAVPSEKQRGADGTLPCAAARARCNHFTGWMTQQR
jgi:hypothetical protein